MITDVQLVMVIYITTTLFGFVLLYYIMLLTRKKTSTIDKRNSKRITRWNGLCRRHDEGMKAYNLLLKAVEYERCGIAKFQHTEANHHINTSTFKLLLRTAIKNRHLNCVENLVKYSIKVGDGPELLGIAVRNRSKELIELLLEHGLDVNTTDEFENSALHHIVLSKQQFPPKDNDEDNLCTRADLINFLLEKGAAINAKNIFGFTTLHLAILNGHEDVVEIILLQHDAVVNSNTENGRDPLYSAIQKKYTEIAKRLLERGASVHSVYTFWYSYTPLHIACENGLIEIVELLLRKGADVNVVAKRKVTPIYLATKSGNCEMVKLLLKYKANVDTEDENGKTILYLAVEQGHSPMVDEILSHSPDINNDSNQNSLRLAVYHGFNQIVKSLLHHGFTFGPGDAKDTNLLRVALENRYLTIAKSLSRNGAQVDDGYKLLDMVVRNRLKEMVKLLLEHGLNINAIDERRNSVLHNIADFDRRLFPEDEELCTRADLTKFLLQERAAVNAKNKLGFTPLHLAAQNRHKDVVEILLEHGADVNVRAKRGKTPLQCAAGQGAEDICRLLLKKGADVHARRKRGLTAMHVAIRYGWKDVVQILLEHGADVNYKRRSSVTLLHFAVQRGREEICMLLLERRADINAKDKYGYTALHMAAQCGHVRIMDILLNSGIDIDSRDGDGNTALHVASRSGQNEAVLTLIENGSHVNIVNKYNQTAFHVINSKNRLKFKIIKRILIKMQIVTEDMSKKDSTDTTSTNGQSPFAKKCEEEMKRMKSTEIHNTNVTFYDILTKPIDRIVLYAGNEDVVQVFKLNDYQKEFPEYGGIIESRFNKGMARKELLDKAGEFVSSCLIRNYGCFPYNCIERILSQLSNKDLMTMKEMNVDSNINDVKKQETV